MTLLARPISRKTRNSPFRRPLKEADYTFDRSSSFGKNYFLEENYKYQDWHLDQARKIVTRIFEHIRPRPEWVFLDVGCALGGIVEILRKRKFEAYGVDISRWCIRNSPVRNYLRFGSATNLPCRSQSIDVTTCIDTFQYLNQDEAKIAAKELRRITKKYLCFECITWEDEKFSNPKENPDTIRKHRSLFTRDEIIELFEKAGFKLKKRRFLPRTIVGSHIGNRNSEYNEIYEYDFSFNAIFEVI